MGVDHSLLSLHCRPLLIIIIIKLADSEEKLCGLVSLFGRVCERRNLRVNECKRKVMRCSNYVNLDRMHMLNELGDSVTATKTFRSCRPTWLEMVLKVCYYYYYLHFASLNVEPLWEVDCFKYLGSQVSADRRCEMDVVHRMIESNKAWEC